MHTGPWSRLPDGRSAEQPPDHGQTLPQRQRPAGKRLRQVVDTNITGDSPSLDDYIERVLSRTFSLLALVTDVTHESWWVPFEIGLAFV